MKKRVNLYLDSFLVEKAQEQGWNVSEFVNQALSKKMSYELRWIKKGGKK